MSSPVSSRRLLLCLQKGLEGSVFGGVVGDAVVPAAPDDVEPGAGQDADGVGVVVAAGVDHRYRVVVTGPVDTARQSVGGFYGKGISGRLHVSLLAASPSGEAPLSWCRGAAAA